MSMKKQEISFKVALSLPAMTFVYWLVAVYYLFDQGNNLLATLCVTSGVLLVGALVIAYRIFMEGMRETHEAEEHEDFEGAISTLGKEPKKFKPLRL